MAQSRKCLETSEISQHLLLDLTLRSSLHHTQDYHRPWARQLPRAAGLSIPAAGTAETTLIISIDH